MIRKIDKVEEMAGLMKEQKLRLDNPRLSPETRGLMAALPFLVSVDSIWEVAIQHRLGKLEVAPAAFQDHRLAARAAVLPVLDGNVIQTARVEGLMAVSSDGHWLGYHVSLHRA